MWSCERSSYFRKGPLKWWPAFATEVEGHGRPQGVRPRTGRIPATVVPHSPSLLRLVHRRWEHFVLCSFCTKWNIRSLWCFYVSLTDTLNYPNSFINYSVHVPILFFLQRFTSLSLLTKYVYLLLPKNSVIIRSTFLKDFLQSLSNSCTNVRDTGYIFWPNLH